MSVRRPRLLVSTAFAALCAVVAAAGVEAQSPSPAPSPTVTATPIPSPSPQPRGRRGRSTPPGPAATATPEPTATPTSPAFASLDGTWEVQIQYMDRTTYAYFAMAQKNNDLSGTWRYEGKQYPFEGTYDGRLIRMVAKLPQGNVTFSGYVEGASDMVGLVDFGKGDPVAFTAEHRGAPKPILQRGTGRGRQ